MTYSLIPSVFLMDIASNGASSIVDSQPNLLKYLQVYLNGGTNPGDYAYEGFFPWANNNNLFYGGPWSVVWGPCVYCIRNRPPITVTNAMYVAYSASLNTYLVSIAATNPISFFDWIIEDGGVDPRLMAPWRPKVPFQATRHEPPIPTTTAAIAAGTATGISDLLTQTAMRDPVEGSLHQFLKAKKNKDATLIFGGHSLAGALSPTLAFYLYPRPLQAGWKQVLVLPTAGATPGNATLAADFNQIFQPVPDTTGTQDLYWNTDYANTHDVVPHAWDKLAQVVQRKDADDNYPSIWGVLKGPGIKTVGGFVNLAVNAARVLAHGYYTAIQQQWVTPDWGTWDWEATYPPTWTPLPTYTDAMPLSTAEQLGQIIQATHVNQYYNFFGVVPAPLMQKPSASTGERTEQMIPA
jgi:Lipase (class 3)